MFRVFNILPSLSKTIPLQGSLYYGFVVKVRAYLYVILLMSLFSLDLYPSRIRLHFT